MKTFIQWVLLVSFALLIALVLISSYMLFIETWWANTIDLPEPSSPPVPPTPITLAPYNPELDLEPQVEVYTQQVNAYTQQVAGYTQQVSAYTQQIDAYKTFAELTVQSRRAAVYELVVKDTLSSLLNAFVSFLLGYVFIKVGGIVIDNYIRILKRFSGFELSWK